MSQQFLDILSGKLRFDSGYVSFCTHYSWFGVAKKDRLGIEELCLSYNRYPAVLSPNLLTFRIEHPEGGSERQANRADLPLQIEESDGQGFWGRITFADSDILCYSAALDADSTASEVRATLLLPATEPRLERRAGFDSATGHLTIETRMPRTDPRDPDPDHPLTVWVTVPDAFSAAGTIADGQKVDLTRKGTVETDGPLVINFVASRRGMAEGEQTFVVGIGEGPTADKIENRMSRVRRTGSKSALEASRNWLSKALDKFTFDGVPMKLRLGYARAAYQILCNTKSARGQIGRPALFPSRGLYCTHYLWDTCFTNLGVSHFNESLAEDFLVALCENQESDGKIPQFVCATWNRPGESQPPLIAWSAWRLYEQYGNKELVRDVYEPLCRMVDWWFENRDQDGDGVVEYQHALESGWDDSPRFDKGRVAAVDLNAYLNREMRLLVKMAPVLARDSEAGVWESRAAEHAKRIYARLFDREHTVFYDRLVEEDRLHRVLTPASFAPLWAEVPMPREATHQMIVKYLINPKCFFGSRPFPVVAYSDRRYQPDKWWRGPVWANIAWTMTEVLRMYGFEKEHKSAVKRLVDMMAQGGELNELYSSATGKPLGAPAHCWSCGVFMEMARKAF